MTAGTVNRITALCLFLIVLVIYLMTVAPTISFWDAAEFITCACTMGIPHPPGSPLMSLVGRVMSIIPFYDFRGGGFGSSAYRINLIAVLTGALTVMLTYLIVVRLITRIALFGRRPLHDGIVMVSAAAAALIAAFSEQFWENTVETETYMPSLLLSMLAVWLTLRWEEHKDDLASLRYLFLAAYIIGLGNGIHLYVMLIVPTVVLIVVLAQPSWFRETRLWLVIGGALAGIGLLRLAGGRGILYGAMGLLSLAGPYFIARCARKTSRRWMLTLWGLLMCLSLYGIGYSVYPTIAVRASKKPIINEGNPDTWTRYTEYLDRKQYIKESMYAGMFRRSAGTGYQFGYMYARYLFQQFPLWGPGIDLSFTNNQSPDAPDAEITIRQTVRVSLGLWIIVLFGMVLHARGDWRKFAVFFLYFLLSSVGLVLYLNMENPQARERDYFFLGSFQIIMVWVGFGVYGVLTLAQRFAARLERPAVTVGGVVLVAAVLASMVPAAVFSRHIDPAYTNYQVHDRSRNWIPLDYGINILDSCPQDAILFTNGDNDTYPLWYAREVLGLRHDVRVVNLSLLNGPWYIKQLRDEDVTVPITYSDNFIDTRLCGDNLLSGRTRTWSPEPKEVSIEGMTWKMPPAAVGAVGGERIGILTVSNIMVLHILKENKWKRPVYFGVTVDPLAMIGLFEHISMEGMVFRLVKEEAPKDRYHIDAPVLAKNIFERYSYRGVTDSMVYKSHDTVNLFTNYTIAFIRLCERYIELGDHENALRAARGAMELKPQLDQRILLYSLLWYGDLRDEYDRLIAQEMERLPLDDPPASTRVGILFYQMALGEKAVEIFKLLYKRYPDNPDVLKGYITSLFAMGNYGEAFSINKHLLEVAPEDSEARKTLEIISGKLNSGKAPE